MTSDLYLPVDPLLAVVTWVPPPPHDMASKEIQAQIAVFRSQGARQKLLSQEPTIRLLFSSNPVEWCFQEHGFPPLQMEQK